MFGDELQDTMVRTSDAQAAAASSQRARKELDLLLTAFSFPRKTLTAAAGFMPGQDQSRNPGAGGAGFF